MLFKILLIVVGVVTGIYAYIRLQQRKTIAELKAIPTVPFFNWPFLGSGCKLLFRRPWDELGVWLDRYGGPRKLLRFEFMTKHFFVIGDLNLVKHILDTKTHFNYVKDSKTFAPFMDLLGTGLVTSEGDKWAKQRRILSPAFKGPNLQHVATSAFAATKRMLGNIAQRIGAGDVVEWNREFRAMTLQVIAQSIMSLSPQESDEILPRLYLPIVDEANKRTWHPWRWLWPNAEYKQAVADLNSFVSRIIENRWAERSARARLASSGALQLDILDRLLFDMFQSQLSTSSSSSSSSSSNGGGGLEDGEETEDSNAQHGFSGEDESEQQSCPAWATSQLRDEIKTFLLAGHETSSLMLTWAIYEITQNPAVEQRVLEEACSIFPTADFEVLPDYRALANLNYTEAVLKEALRKYSVVPVVTREALKTEVVDGVTIPAGATLTLPLRYLHHRADLWEQPEHFIPERWEQTKMNRWQFMGFLQGPRVCIGQHFALLEAKIVLAMIIRAFNVSSCRQTNPTPHRFVIPVHPEAGMTLFVRPRLD